VPHKAIIASVSEHQTVFLNRFQVAGQEVALRSAARKAAIAKWTSVHPLCMQEGLHFRAMLLQETRNSVEVKCSVNVD
jgi:hypothetical protein